MNSETLERGDILIDPQWAKPFVGVVLDVDNDNDRCYYVWFVGDELEWRIALCREVVKYKEAVKEYL